jgi:hypothetical protein
MSTPIPIWSYEQRKMTFDVDIPAIEPLMPAVAESIMRHSHAKPRGHDLGESDYEIYFRDDLNILFCNGVPVVIVKAEQSINEKVLFVKTAPHIWHVPGFIDTLWHAIYQVLWTARKWAP